MLFWEIFLLFLTGINADLFLNKKFILLIFFGGCLFFVYQFYLPYQESVNGKKETPEGVSFYM